MSSSSEFGTDITPPVEPPGDDQDERSKGEATSAKRAAMRPAERNTHLYESWLNEAREEKRELKGLLGSRTAKLETAQEDFANNAEEVARIKLANTHMRTNLSFTTLALGIGGTLVGQYSRGGPWLYAGWVLVMMGCFYVMLSLIANPEPKET